MLTGCAPKKKLSSSRTPSSKGILSDISTQSKFFPLENKNTVLDSFSEVLDVDKRHLNSNLYHFVYDWMGVKHRDGGTNKMGIDCSAFVGILFQQIYKKIIPRSSAQMGEMVKRNYEKDLKEGDLVFFSFGGKRIDHVGVYLHNGIFVHVSTSKGVILSKLRDPWYYKYYVRSGSIE